MITVLQLHIATVAVELRNKGEIQHTIFNKEEVYTMFDYLCKPMCNDLYCVNVTHNIIM